MSCEKWGKKKNQRESDWTQTGDLFFFFWLGNPMPSVYHWRHHDSHNADLFAQYFFFAK
jgi:hypothetical protein